MPTSSTKTSSQPPPSKKQRTTNTDDTETSSSSPKTTTTTTTPTSSSTSPPHIIILLDQARLETIKTRKNTYELLNCDDHRDLCRRKLKKDPTDYRPDILHQELLACVDSPLNKSGLLQLYVRTTKNILIELHKSVRIPRTYKRFAGLMVQLLHKLKIKASENGTVLMKVIKNPLSRHLSAGVRMFGMSCKGTLYSPYVLGKRVVEMGGGGAGGGTVGFVIGAMAKGSIEKEEHEYIEEMISVSGFPLSGAAAVARLLGGIEHHLGLV